MDRMPDCRSTFLGQQARATDTSEPTAGPSRTPDPSVASDMTEVGNSSMSRARESIDPRPVEDLPEEIWRSIQHDMGAAEYLKLRGLTPNSRAITADSAAELTEQLRSVFPAVDTELGTLVETDEGRLTRFGALADSVCCVVSQAAARCVASADEPDTIRYTGAVLPQPACGGQVMLSASLNPHRFVVTGAEADVTGEYSIRVPAPAPWVNLNLLCNSVVGSRSGRFFMGVAPHHSIVGIQNLNELLARDHYARGIELGFPVHGTFAMDPWAAISPDGNRLATVSRPRAENASPLLTIMTVQPENPRAHLDRQHALGSATVPYPLPGHDSRSGILAISDQGHCVCRHESTPDDSANQQYRIEHFPPEGPAITWNINSNNQAHTISADGRTVVFGTIAAPLPRDPSGQLGGDTPATFSMMRYPCPQAFALPPRTWAVAFTPDDMGMLLLIGDIRPGERRILDASLYYRRHGQMVESLGEESSQKRQRDRMARNFDLAEVYPVIQGIELDLTDADGTGGQVFMMAHDGVNLVIRRYVADPNPDFELGNGWNLGTLLRVQSYRVTNADIGELIKRIVRERNALTERQDARFEELAREEAELAREEAKFARRQVSPPRPINQWRRLGIGLRRRWARFVGARDAPAIDHPRPENRTVWYDSVEEQHDELNIRLPERLALSPDQRARQIAEASPDPTIHRVELLFDPSSTARGRYPESASGLLRQSPLDHCDKVPRARSAAACEPTGPAVTTSGAVAAGAAGVGRRQQSPALPVTTPPSASEALGIIKALAEAEPSSASARLFDVDSSGAHVGSQIARVMQEHPRPGEVALEACLRLIQQLHSDGALGAPQVLALLLPDQDEAPPSISSALASHWTLSAVSERFVAVLGDVLDRNPDLKERIVRQLMWRQRDRWHPFAYMRSPASFYRQVWRSAGRRVRATQRLYVAGLIPPGRLASSIRFALRQSGAESFIAARAPERLPAFIDNWPALVERAEQDEAERAVLIERARANYKGYLAAAIARSEARSGSRLRAPTQTFIAGLLTSGQWAHTRREARIAEDAIQRELEREAERSQRVRQVGPGVEFLLGAVSAYGAEPDRDVPAPRATHARHGGSLGFSNPFSRQSGSRATAGSRAGIEGGALTGNSPRDRAAAAAIARWEDPNRPLVAPDSVPRAIRGRVPPFADGPVIVHTINDLNQNQPAGSKTEQERFSTSDC